MAQIRRAPLAALLVLALPLSACLTPRVHPQPSQAVLDARAHKDVSSSSCPAAGVSEISPVYARFPFNEGELPGPAKLALDTAAGWLTCHPQTGVAISGAADNHGTPSDQQALARKRQQAVAAYLGEKGVAAARIRLLPKGQAAPADALAVVAEGRGW